MLYSFIIKKLNYTIEMIEMKNKKMMKKGVVKSVLDFPTEVTKGLKMKKKRMNLL